MGALTVMLATVAMNQQATPQTRVYGSSVLGEPLEVTRFGSSGPVTLIFFAIHGSERSTKPCGELLRARLTQEPGLTRDTQVLLVTVANPDGWRARTRMNAKGVDLNRNFPDGWKPEPLEKRKNPGPYPLSEPESQALAKLVLDEKPDQVVSVHQPLVCVNPDGEYSVPLANVMAAANGYPVVVDMAKPTPGSFGHWCAARRIPLVTLEMPAKDVATCWKENEAALVAAIRFGASVSKKR